MNITKFDFDMYAKKKHYENKDINNRPKKKVKYEPLVLDCIDDDNDIIIDNYMYKIIDIDDGIDEYLTIDNYMYKIIPSY